MSTELLWDLVDLRVVYNYLSATLPRYDDTLSKLGRSAVIGFMASMVSDCCSNSIRVIKVYKQANTEAITYPEALKRVLKEDGVAGLFGRGLQTKIISNMQRALSRRGAKRLYPRKRFRIVWVRTCIA